MEIAAGTGKLNVQSFDRLLVGAAPIWSTKPKSIHQVTLNLSQISFVDPFGLAGLAVLTESLGRRTRVPPVIVLPTNQSVTGYLSRLGAWDHLGRISELRSDAPLASHVSGQDSDVLLELSRISAAADIQKILGNLSAIIENNLGYSRTSVNAVMNTLSELCQNIVDHSDTTGWAVAQRYHRSNGSCFVWIGVADAGVGIKQSLGARYPVQNWTHFDSIVYALKKNVSRLPNRGLGLHMVNKIVNEFRGSLHIRSGDSRLSVADRAEGIPGAWFLGTQVGISLSENSGA